MPYPHFKEFLQLSRKYNLIPVYTQVNADLDTPVSAYLKLKKNDYAFLLESVEGQEKIARYSFLGTHPSLLFEAKERTVKITDFAKNKKYRLTTQDSPIAEIKKLMRSFRPAPVSGLPRFYGGLVGYIGYEAVRQFEQLPNKNKDELNLPDYSFMLTDNLLIFDHINHKIKIISNVDLRTPGRNAGYRQKAKAYQEAAKKIERIKGELTSLQPEEGGRKDSGDMHRYPTLHSNFTRPGFSQIVKKATKTYIKNGDIIQVVLSQRLKIRTDKEPFQIYRSLRSLNPSPYMFHLKFKDVNLVGASPEMFVRCENRKVETRPIAGTRPRSDNPKEESDLERELLNDPKERSEHIMLVDLGRNDLGRVCRPGTIKVSDFMRVEKYSHVMHLVSEVEGVLDKKYDSYDALKACFPAGTVSGSPKIRAMEIIEELENTRRGHYAGCVGYFAFSGNLDTCITLRTILLKNKIAYIQAGAGIVADSRPEREYRESMNKAKALIEAIAE